MTDEYSDVFEDGEDVFDMPDDGNLISCYNILCLMGIHRPLHISNVAAYVTAIQKGKSGEPLSGEDLMLQGIWEEPGNPVEVLKSLQWDSLGPVGTSAYYSEIYKRKWQVVPEDRCYKLSRILVDIAVNNPKYKSILFDLSLFLNTVVEPSKNIKSEKHAIILTSKDGKSVYITASIKNGNIVGYNAYAYNKATRTIDVNTLTKLPFNNQIPISDWAKQLLGDSNADIKLLRAVTRQDDVHELVDITANDQLFLLLSSTSHNPQLLSELDDDLMKTPEFLHNIYMDDTAGDFYDGSEFFRKFEGDYMNGYVTPVQNMMYSTYKIDTKKIIPDSNPTEDPNSELATKINIAKQIINDIKNVVKDKVSINWNVSDETLSKQILNVNARVF